MQQFKISRFQAVQALEMCRFNLKQYFIIIGNNIKSRLDDGFWRALICSQARAGMDPKNDTFDVTEFMLSDPNSGPGHDDGAKTCLESIHIDDESTEPLRLLEAYLSQPDDSCAAAADATTDSLSQPQDAFTQAQPIQDYSSVTQLQIPHDPPTNQQEIHSNEDRVRYPINHEEKHHLVHGDAENKTTETMNDDDEELCLDDALIDDLFNFDDIPALDCFDLDSNNNDKYDGSSGTELDNNNNNFDATATDTNENDEGATNNCVQKIKQLVEQESQAHEIANQFEMRYYKFASVFLEWVMQQPDPHCQSCQILRRIVHSNGLQDSKLEIHRSAGEKFHAVLHVRFCSFGNGACQNNTPSQVLQFPRGNFEYMKHFLMQYSLLRAKEGFALRYDCVVVSTHAGTGLSSISDPWFPGPLASYANRRTDFTAGQAYFGRPNLNPWTACQNPPSGPNPTKFHKSFVAAQRERTGKLQLSDCAHYFHLPISEAAKKLAICPTVLKKICRRNGLPRWPHRKIKSIDRIIATLEQTIAEGNGVGAESITNEIALLKKQRAQLSGAQLSGGFLLNES